MSATGSEIVVRLKQTLQTLHIPGSESSHEARWMAAFTCENVACGSGSVVLEHLPVAPFRSRVPKTEPTLRTMAPRNCVRNPSHHWLWMSTRPS